MFSKPVVEKIPDIPRNAKAIVDEKTVEQICGELAEEKKLQESEKKVAIAPSPVPPAPGPITTMTMDSPGLFSSPARNEEPAERLRKRTEERPRRDKGSAGERRRSLPKYSSKMRSEKKPPHHRHSVVDGNHAFAYRTTHYSNPNSPFHAQRQESAKLQHGGSE